jgi:UDP-N-acetylmuramoyl-tripeptide--D-alanyl-D-alanine ligase
MKMNAVDIAAAIGAEIVAEGGAGAARRATIDSGETGPEDLFFGLRGERADGCEFAPAAAEAGAWGVVVRPECTAGIEGAWVFSVADPLAASLASLVRSARPR